MFPTVVPAPVLPDVEEPLLWHLVAGADFAAVAKEGLDWAPKLFELLDQLGRRVRLEEPAAAIQSVPALKRPIENTGQLGNETIEERMIFVAQEGPGQPPH